MTHIKDITISIKLYPEKTKLIELPAANVMEQKTSTLVVLDRTYNQILIIVIDVTENDYLARDIMLIQPTNYRAIEISYMDHQQYVAIGTPLNVNNQQKGDDKYIMVVYSVNQAGQLKTIDQFVFLDYVNADKQTFQIKLIAKDKLLILDNESSQVKVMDVEKERASKIVFDQIITEKIRTIRPLNEVSLLLTTQSNQIFLINY